MGFDFVSFFPRAVMQGIPLLFGSTGEILTEKSGNLNLGIPGIMYVGGISGVIGAFFYEQSASGALNPFLAVLIPILSSLLGSLFIWVLALVMILTVYGRFFKLYMATAIAPIPLSSFAGQPSSSIGMAFIKSYAAICLEGCVILLACIIFSQRSSGTTLVSWCLICWYSSAPLKCPTGSSEN